MKTCLPCLHRGLEVDRAEAGRRGEDDQVDAGVDRLLVGVEAGEDWSSATSTLLAVLLLEVLRQRLAGVVLEGVGDGDELDRPLGAQRLASRAGAAAAATDRPILIVSSAGREDAADRQERSRRRRACDDPRRTLKEIPTAAIVLSHFCLLPNRV